MKEEKVSTPLDENGRGSQAWQHAYGQGIASYFVAAKHCFLQIYNGEKTVSLTNGAGKIGQPHVKERN